MVCKGAKDSCDNHLYKYATLSDTCQELCQKVLEHPRKHALMWRRSSLRRLEGESQAEQPATLATASQSVYFYWAYPHKHLEMVICVSGNPPRHFHLHTTAGAGPMSDHAVMEPHEPYKCFHAIS